MKHSRHVELCCGYRDFTAKAKKRNLSRALNDRRSALHYRNLMSIPHSKIVMEYLLLRLRGMGENVEWANYSEFLAYCHENSRIVAPIYDELMSGTPLDLTGIVGIEKNGLTYKIRMSEEVSNQIKGMAEDKFQKLKSGVANKHHHSANKVSQVELSEEEMADACASELKGHSGEVTAKMVISKETVDTSENGTSDKEDESDANLFDAYTAYNELNSGLIHMWAYAWATYVTYGFDEIPDNNILISAVIRRLIENCNIQPEDFSAAFSITFGSSDTSALQMNCANYKLNKKGSSNAGAFSSLPLLHDISAESKALFGLLVIAFKENRIQGIVKTILEYSCLAMASFNRFVSVVLSKKMLNKRYKKFKTVGVFDTGVWTLWTGTCTMFNVIFNIDSLVCTRDNAKFISDKFEKVNDWLMNYRKLEEGEVGENYRSDETGYEWYFASGKDNYIHDVYSPDPTDLMERYLPFYQMDSTLTGDLAHKLMVVSPAEMCALLSSNDFTAKELESIEPLSPPTMALISAGGSSKDGKLAITYLSCPVKKDGKRFKYEVTCQESCLSAAYVYVCNPNALSKEKQEASKYKLLYENCNKKLESQKAKLKLKTDETQALKKQLEENADLARVRVETETASYREQIESLTKQVAELSSELDKTTNRLISKSQDYSHVAKENKKLRAIQANLSEEQLQEAETAVQQVQEITLEQKVRKINKHRLLIVGVERAIQPKLVELGLDNFIFISEDANKVKKLNKVKFDELFIMTTGLSHAFFYRMCNFDKTGYKTHYYGKINAEGFVNYIYDELEVSTHG